MGFLKSLRDKTSSSAVSISSSTQKSDSNPRGSSRSRPQAEKDMGMVPSSSSSDNKRNAEKPGGGGGGGGRGNEYQPPSGPPPPLQSNYTPPTGPPPSSQSQPNYESPAGPPPPDHSYNQTNSESNYIQPPPGPPPSYSNPNHSYNPHIEQTQPQPQPRQQEAPPSYETWLSAPYNNNASLPPPPSLPQEFSPVNNASFDSADRGAQFCSRYSLVLPSIPTNEIYGSVQNRNVGIDRPPPGSFLGELEIVDLSDASTRDVGRRFRIKSMPKLKRSLTKPSGRFSSVRPDPARGPPTGEIEDSDVCVMSQLPLYFALADNPLANPQNNQYQKTIFFSLKIISLPSSPPSGLAIGFASRPYPPFRLPGWHRGSLAVHSDDGRRYINDPFGGIDFVRPFNQGDEIGIGVTITFERYGTEIYRQQGQVGGGKASRVEAFFIRNDREEGRWDVNEQRDAEFSGPDGLLGLLGERDLFAAIGLFGSVEVELSF